MAEGLNKGGVLAAEALAYLGDAAMELLIRERLVRAGICSSQRLNLAALAYVKATAQSEALERMLPHLTEAEEQSYKRGRNSGNGKNTPRSASVTEYRRATGLEVLFGQLYLDGNTARMQELLDIGYPDLPKEK